MTDGVVISRLGAQGDGIANTAEGPAFIPFALPGETWKKGEDGGHELVAETASTDRVTPVCRHFGICGGCTMQHLARAPYLAWKASRIDDALASRGIDVSVDPISGVDPGTRRRAVFSARMTADGPLLGYMQHRANVIVPIEECPLLDPAISRHLDLLHDLLRLVGPTAAPFHVGVIATAAGLDVTLADLSPVSGTKRKQYADFAIEAGLARISIDDEVLLAPRDPVVRFGDVEVLPPPGAFLQAVETAEMVMAGLVSGHLAKSKRVIDLFAGCGTFALRLAKSSAVHAVEGEQAALDALDRGFRFGTGLRRVTTERRDLMRRPVTYKELSAFDGLVFDPPRAGAEAQAVQIARTDIPLVAAVSCNPATLARDLRILIDGGYRVERIVPVDQFLWSAHVEAVALMSKPRKRRRR